LRNKIKLIWIGDTCPEISISVQMKTFYNDKSNDKYKEQNRVGKREKTSQIMLEYIELRSAIL